MAEGTLPGNSPRPTASEVILVTARLIPAVESVIAAKDGKNQLVKPYAGRRCDSKEYAKADVHQSEQKGRRTLESER